MTWCVVVVEVEMIRKRDLIVSSLVKIGEHLRGLQTKKVPKIGLNDDTRCTVQSVLMHLLKNHDKMCELNLNRSEKEVSYKIRG